MEKGAKREKFQGDHKKFKNVLLVLPVEFYVLLPDSKKNYFLEK